MKLKILAIFLSFALLGCSNTQKNYLKTPQESATYLEKYGSTLSLDEVLEIAHERNLDLQIKKLETEIATLDKRIAFGNFLPKIVGGGAYTRLDDDISLEMNLPKLPPNLPIKFPSSIDAKIVDQNMHIAGVGATIPIFVPSTWYLYSARQKGENISKLVESLSEKMLKLQVMSQYFYILSLESEKDVLENNLKSAREILKKAEISYKVDGILEWEVQRAGVLVKSNEIALHKNESDLRVAKMELKRSLNLNLDTDIVLEKFKTKVVKLPSLEEAIYEALNTNELLKIADIKKDVDKDMKKIAITNFLPKIILSGGYINSNNHILADPDFLFGNVSGILSIFNGFQNINEYKKAVRRAKIGELTLEKQFMTTVLEVTRAYENVKTVGEMLELAELNLVSQSGMLHQKSVEKRVEMIGEDDYYKALSEYYTALLEKSKLEYQYQLALGALSIAMGGAPYYEEEKTK